MDWGKALASPEQPVTDQPAAAAVADQLNTTTPPEEAPVLAPPVAEEQLQPTPDTPPTPAAPAAPAPFDFAALDPMSGGLIKDEASFKAILPKLTEYDALKAKNDELSALMAKAPSFADDEVRILNELKAGGASKEQIKTFQKINEYGNLAELPDRDARIARMVMIDGVKPSVAEYKVDQQYSIGNEDLSEIDREVNDDNLRVDAIKDREALAKYKAEITQPNQVSPEELQLQHEAKKVAHQAQIKPYVKDVVTTIPNLGVFNLSGKDGAEAVNFELPFDESTRAQIQTGVENFFMDGLVPVTPENTRLALQYARAEYFREHAGEMLAAAYAKGVNLTTEALTNKYENRSGLRPQQDSPIVQGNAAAETAAWMANKVNRVGQQ